MREIDARQDLGLRLRSSGISFSSAAVTLSRSMHYAESASYATGRHNVRFGGETWRYKTAALATATAAALRPSATVNSVIEAALAQLPDVPGARREVETVVGWARKAKDYKELRVIYADRYRPSGGRFPITQAIEILGGGLAALRLADGRAREAVLYATNMGRDTDCKAYVAAGLAGAMRGIEAWPPEWVQTVEKAGLTDPYTVDKRTPRQLAEGLYKAALNEHAKAKGATSEVDSLLAK